MTWKALQSSFSAYKIAFVGVVQKQAAEAAARHDDATLHRCVKRLSSVRRRGPQALELADGRWAATPLVVARRWQEHWASKVVATLSVCIATLASP